MGRTTDLRGAIKDAFVPYLGDRGFSPDMRRAPRFFTFRKIDTDAVYVCDILWEKYGRPRFIVNFGKCSAQGVVVRGERILPEDVFPGDTPQPGRLAPGRRRTTAGWFRQDRSLLARLVSRSKLYSTEAVIAQLITLFGEVEEFWMSGIAGPHLRWLPIPTRLAAKDFLA